MRASLSGVPALLLTAAFAFTAAPAFAQTGQPNVDSDADGVSDAVDAEPCNANVSARVYVPADRTYGMMLFEDQWPSRGDFDFNDAVVGYNQVLRYNSSGQVTGLRLELSVMAVGAGAINGLAWRLPGTPRASVTGLSYSVGNVVNAPGAIRLDESAAEATFILSENLHALFGTTDGREHVNTNPSLPMRDYVDMVVELTLQPGVNLSAADAPFDLFLFNAFRGTEVHRPRYRGTDAMNAAHYNTAADGSSPTRSFVTTGGIPFAIELPELTSWPREEAPIDSLYPGIVAFGASNGAQSQDFYRHPAQGSAFGLVPPRPLTAQVAADVTCFAPNPGICGAATGTGSVAAPASSLCGFGDASTVTASGGLWRWSCAGDYSQPTNCTAPQWACQPNAGTFCTLPNGGGTMTCNGSGTGFGSCTLNWCDPGYLPINGVCVPQTCSPNSVRACTVANGTATETCDHLGSAWGPCTVDTCDTGYVRNGTTCIASMRRILYTLSSTFTVPPGVTSIRALVVGGGGGGGNGHQGGGGAGYISRATLNVTPGAAITLTVGAGGAGAAPCTGCNTISGNSVGGTSSFGSLLSAAGGGTPTVVNGPAGSGSSGGGGACNAGSPAGTGGAGGANGTACTHAAGSGMGASAFNAALANLVQSTATAGAGGAGGTSSHSGGGGAGGVLMDGLGANAANGPRTWSGRGGRGYGAGGGAGGYDGATSTVRERGGAGAGGMIYVEW